MVYTLIIKKWADDSISIIRIKRSNLKIKKAFFLS
jgi:hypothetical protein